MPNRNWAAEDVRYDCGSDCWRDHSSGTPIRMDFFGTTLLRPSQVSSCNPLRSPAVAATVSPCPVRGRRLPSYWWDYCFRKLMYRVLPHTIRTAAVWGRDMRQVSLSMLFVFAAVIC